MATQPSCTRIQDSIGSSDAGTRLDHGHRKRTTGIRALRLLCFLAPLLLGATATAERPSVDFNRDVRPILSRHCTACHGGVKQAGGISFVYRDKAMGTAKSGAVPIVPGNPAASEIIRRVTTDNEEDRMPPKSHAEGARLTPDEVGKLRAWIAAGAPWGAHWSHQMPVAPPTPRVGKADWPRQALDGYVLEQMEAAGLEPTPEAPRHQWLRRVTLDLTGLPPTEAQVAAFVDGRETHEQVVERLLASPAFGERWASMWLDLARYADTMGYERDPHRDMWAYRDWVVRAFNKDMPFDEFTIRQLAGDLLPGATLDDRIATGFHRNTQTNAEGGTDDEEFRVASVIDRVNTTWTVWQATTFGCVQCHNHPYDPFRQDEYYAFYSMFNNSEDSDANSEFPKVSIPEDPARWPEAHALDGLIARLRQEINEAGRSLALAEPWKPLAVAGITGPPEATFSVKTNEVRVDGTVPVGGEYKIRISDPPQAITALRLDILPRSDDPKLWPEYGAVVSHFQMEILAPGYAAAEASKGPDSAELTNWVSTVRLTAVYADALTEPFDPEESLKPGDAGGGEYPRLNGPRWLVFVPDAPVAVPAGATLRLRLAQQIDDDGHNKGAIVHHFRLGFSASPAWTSLLQSKADRELRAQWSAARQKRATIPGKTTLVMQERPAGRTRETRLFIRGSFLAKDRPVSPGVPAVLPPLPAGGRSRLDMARWLVSPENPLTARVFVNRIWSELFGTGLVETLEDFGAAGMAPSHPALLDWLALRFQGDQQWQLKPLLRELVLSATYRQDHRASPDRLARDPRNRFLARGPRTRLSAEMVRDQALSVAGVLGRRLGGPPVKPPQPDGVWNVVYNGDRWVNAQGEDRWRRALYTYWRRTSPYPSLITFDASSREICTARRLPTNTPLQALVTMNDPVFLEAAQNLARRMAAEGGDRPEDQAAWAFRLVTGESPGRHKAGVLASLYGRAVARYEAEPGLWKALADSPGAAARTLVASTILNSDGALTK